ncbi:MAG: S41 family peptidase [Pseudomonadota bacterium]
MSDNSSLHMRPDKKSNVFEFKVLQELPASCSQPISRADVLRVFLSTMGSYYPAFARRGVNWLKRSTEIGARITDIDNDEDLLRQMAKSVEGLNDPLLAIDTGSFVWTDPEAESDEFDLLREGFARQDVYSSLEQYQLAWHQAVRSRLKNLALSDMQTAIDGSVIWGQLASGAAYMHVSSFERGSVDDWRKALHAFRKFQLKRNSVVLDLSMLNSANDAVGSLFASAFLPEKSILYKSRFHQRPEGSWNPHENQWRGKQLNIRPLYLLTSNETAGAGERVVLALKGQSGITQVGTTTRGAMSEAFFRSLPNNWLLRLGSVEFADRGDVPYDGIGLVPDFNLAFFPEGQISQGHFLALQTLDELIAEGHFAKREQASPKNTF